VNKEKRINITYYMYISDIITKISYLFIFYFLSYNINNAFTLDKRFLFEITQIESKIDSCRQIFSLNEYDLNQLSNFTIFGEETSFRYAITPCGLVPTDRCRQNTSPFEAGMTACQERLVGSTPSFQLAIGFLDGYGKPPNLEFSENTDGSVTGVTMMMRNARCNGGERTVKVVFICNENIKTPTEMNAVEFPACQFTLQIKAAGACPI